MQQLPFPYPPQEVWFADLVCTQLVPQCEPPRKLLVLIRDTWVRISGVPCTCVVLPSKDLDLPASGTHPLNELVHLIWLSARLSDF